MRGEENNGSLHSLTASDVNSLNPHGRVLGRAPAGKNVKKRWSKAGVQVTQDPRLQVAAGIQTQGPESSHHRVSAPHQWTDSGCKFLTTRHGQLAAFTAQRVPCSRKSPLPGGSHLTSTLRDRPGRRGEAGRGSRPGGGASRDGRFWRS